MLFTLILCRTLVESNISYRKAPEVGWRWRAEKAFRRFINILKISQSDNCWAILADQENTLVSTGCGWLKSLSFKSGGGRNLRFTPWSQSHPKGLPRDIPKFSFTPPFHVRHVEQTERKTGAKDHPSLPRPAHNKQVKVYTQKNRCTGVTQKNRG